jgi:DNA-binding NtrC family response regulator
MLSGMARSDAPPLKITPDAMEKLRTHDFPGNVRELRNILQKAAAVCNHGLITSSHIHLGNKPLRYVDEEMPVLREDASIARVEAEHILALLHRHGGHRRRVADDLGISERTLYRKITLYTRA